MLMTKRKPASVGDGAYPGRVFGNGAEFWLNVQRRSDLWEAMHSPRELARIARARALSGGD